MQCRYELATAAAEQSARYSSDACSREWRVAGQLQLYASFGSAAAASILCWTGPLPLCLPLLLCPCVVRAALNTHELSQQNHAQGSPPGAVAGRPQVLRVDHSNSLSRHGCMAKEQLQGCEPAYKHSAYPFAGVGGGNSTATRRASVMPALPCCAQLLLMLLQGAKACHAGFDMARS